MNKLINNNHLSEIETSIIYLFIFSFFLITSFSFSYLFPLSFTKIFNISEDSSIIPISRSLTFFVIILTALIINLSDKPNKDILSLFNREFWQDATPFKSAITAYYVVTTAYSTLLITFLSIKMFQNGFNIIKATDIFSEQLKLCLGMIVLMLLIRISQLTFRNTYSSKQ